MYIISEKPVLVNNMGFALYALETFEEAHEKAEIGQFVHKIDVQEVWSVVNGGKLFRKVE